MKVNAASFTYGLNLYIPPLVRKQLLDWIYEVIESRGTQSVFLDAPSGSRKLSGLSLLDRVDQRTFVMATRAPKFFFRNILELYLVE